ncbi:hypothetical protein DFP72DRAFT_1081064 [Ephemerocybe angulata]|uniref:Uncharacterized protein n=1 Tax=Ephemerocybe angulata TaxID=980116 RepID=A0A8H6H9F1_9AGAR|nr:hypothetical protein DFP72DRAFT_1081064 [Tulosesus angulatus]
MGNPPRLIAARILSFSGKHAQTKSSVEGMHTTLTLASASAGTDIPDDQSWSVTAAGKIVWVGSAGEAFPLTLGDGSRATGVSATSIIDLEPGHGDHEGFNFRLVRECDGGVGLDAQVTIPSWFPVSSG